MENSIEIVERNIGQLRGYFKGQEDISIKENALRMLDEIELIVKRKLEHLRGI